METGNDRVDRIVGAMLSEAASHIEDVGEEGVSARFMAEIAPAFGRFIAREIARGSAGGHLAAAGEILIAHVAKSLATFHSGEPPSEGAVLEVLMAAYGRAEMDIQRNEARDLARRKPAGRA